MSTQATKTNSRRALHAYVSDEAHDSWHAFAAEHGVTVSGLLEALTAHLRPESRAPNLEAAWMDSITNARAVDARRRRRS